ncbi:Fic family protein, partial [Glutamicibacter sp. 287]
ARGWFQQSSSQKARRVSANVRAMESTLAQADELSSDAILKMFAELLQSQAGWKILAGTYREHFVWVGSSAANPRETGYAPARSGLQAELIEGLFEFMAHMDLPAALQMEIAHAKFERIHPFADGNGRTGRPLVQSLLWKRGMVRSTSPSPSAGLLRCTGLSFEALARYRDGKVAPILDGFMEAILYAVSSIDIPVDQMASHLDSARAKHQGLLPQSMAW